MEKSFPDFFDFRALFAINGKMKIINPPDASSVSPLSGLAAIFGAMQDAVVITDPSGKIVYLNPQALRMTGWEEGQQVSLDCAEIEILRNGHHVPLSIVVSPLASHPGTDATLSYYIVTLHDQTEHAVQMEILRNTIAALEKSNEALTRSNSALKKFSNIAAHDLKSPVGAIIQLTDILNSKYAASLDPKGNELLRCIGDSASRMRILIDDLLNYSSLTTGGPGIPTDCTAALEQALDNLKKMIQESKALVSYSALPEIPVAPPHLTQVFQNMIRNAVQYAGVPEPTIHIAANAGEAGWIFSVRDNGQGIDPQYYDTIFEPFQRLHGHTHLGSGIGLAICRRIIEGAGGKIWVESAPGVHTTFFFTLP